MNQIVGAPGFPAAQPTAPQPAAQPAAPQPEAAPAYDNIMSVATQQAVQQANQAETNLESALQGLTIATGIAPAAQNPGGQQMVQGEPQPQQQGPGIGMAPAAPPQPQVQPPQPQIQPTAPQIQPPQPQIQPTAPGPNQPISVRMPDGQVVQTTMAQVQAGQVAPQISGQPQQQAIRLDPAKVRQSFDSALQRENVQGMTQQYQQLNEQAIQTEREIQRLNGLQEQWKNYARSPDLDAADMSRASAQLSIMATELGTAQSRIQQIRSHMNGLESATREAGQRALMAAVGEVNPEYGTQAGMSNLYRNVAQAFGFTEGELAANADPRVVMVMDHALRYQQMTSNAEGWINAAPQVQPGAITTGVGPAAHVPQGPPVGAPNATMMNPTGVIPSNIGQMDIDQASAVFGNALDQLESVQRGF